MGHYNNKRETWTLDSGLDHALDSGLNSGVDIYTGISIARDQRSHAYYLTARIHLQAAEFATRVYPLSLY